MRTRARQKRLAAQDHGRHLARQGDPLHVTGCMLYWAEGSKRRNDVEFTNSDPDMLGAFVAFLCRCYEVPRDSVRLTLNVHLNNGLALSEIEEWWLSRLTLPRSALGSHTVNSYSRRSGQTRRTLPFGPPASWSTPPSCSRASTARFRSTPGLHGPSGSISDPGGDGVGPAIQRGPGKAIDRSDPADTLAARGA